MRTASTLRLWVIGLVVVAAAVSFAGTRTGSPFLDWLGFAVFLVAVFAYGSWRLAVRKERTARVFDREAKTDETGTRADQ
jgi:hypothetical protein